MMTGSLPYTLRLFAVISLLFTGSGLVQGRTAGLLATPDTTIVPCNTAAMEYDVWINTLQLELSQPGRFVDVSPAPLADYMFSGPCGDTITHRFVVTDDMMDTVLDTQYTFIAVDTIPPIFSTMLGDTIYLSCKDTIPAASNVMVSDNCMLASVIPNEVTTVSSNCSINQQIQRTYTARDMCGNVAVFTQVIIQRDEAPPTILQEPSDTLVGCTEDTSPDNLGYPVVTDFCDENPQISFTDDIAANADPACVNSYVIRRMWEVIDDCGNTRFAQQNITVRDTVAPTFVVPNDTTVSCTLGDIPEVTGRPTMLEDNCDALDNGNVFYSDVIVASDCENMYTVRRTWFIQDNCGNIDSARQTIQVEDLEAPVFDTLPADLFLSCTEPNDLQQLHADWLADFAGARATDNCSPKDRLQWTLQDTATGLTPVFPALSCNDGDPLIYSQGIRIIVTDECGKADTLIRQFAVTDELPPILSDCPADTALVNDADQCYATFELPFPTIADSCSDIRMPVLTFRLNDGPDSLIDLMTPIMLQLPVDTHTISYTLTDCGGNAVSCSFQVIVADTQRPELICPADIDMPLDSGACTQAIILPMPASATDNCGIAPAFAFPDYYTTGVTTLSRTSMNNPANPPQLIFNRGETQVFYITEDQAGNADTCSFTVTVRDQEAPLARCQPTTLFINPSGLLDEEVGVMDIDAGSTDNCAIDTSFIQPSVFDCAAAGTVDTVTMTVVDLAGNRSQCSTIVRIETIEPQPSANSGLCGNDTLYLIANPPPAMGGTVFTYRWTGPNGFTSTRENPVVPNISSANAGSYEVEVTGITGCTSTGTVEVAIDDLPLTPSIVAANNYCIDEDIELTSSVAPSGNDVTYRWYRGVPPNGTLIRETIVPSLVFEAPHVQSSEQYYLTIEADGCISRPSSPKTINIGEKPVAIPERNSITLCEGEPISLGTQLSGSDITYRWSGPDGFESTNQFPQVIQSATANNGGIYTLIVFRNGCPSEPAFVNVTILDRPDRPELSNNGPACFGEDIQLSTNASGSVYHWIAPDLSEFSTNIPSFDLTAVDNSVEGNWRVYVTNFGCDSEPSLPSTVVVNDLPIPAAAATPDVICEGSSMTLAASPDIINATYRWTGPNDFQAAGKNVQVENMSDAKAGDYKLRITTPEGCADSTSISISVKKGVELLAVTNNGPACLSGPTDIELKAAVSPADNGTYRWSWTGPNGFASNKAIAVIPNATASNNGNYQLVVTNGQGCASQIGSTVVDVTDPPATPAIPTLSGMNTDGQFCEGEQLILETTAYQGTDVIYNWLTPNAGLVSTTDANLTLDDLSMDDAGEYSLYVTVDGCNSRTSGKLPISVNARPQASATSTPLVCEGSPIEFQANFLSGATYLWEGPNFTSSLRNPIIAEADSTAHHGAYTLQITNNGCTSDLAMTTVSVKRTPRQARLQTVDPVCISDNNASLELQLRTSSITSGATYTWLDENGNPISTTTQPALTVTDFGAYTDGIHEFSVVASLEDCPSPVSEPLEVQLNRIPDNQAFAGLDFAACETGEISLRAETPTIGTGRWTLLSADTAGRISITNPNKANSLVDGLEGGERYEFSWTLSNGACFDYSSDNVQVTVNQSEDANAGTDILACASRDIFLDALPSLNGNAFWQQSDVQELLGVSIQEPDNPKTAITGMQPGNLYSFTWTVISGCGEVRDEVFVLISDPNPFAGQDRTVCNDDNTALLEGDEPTEGSKGRWLTTDPDISFSDDQDWNALVSGLKTGVNTFVWEIDRGICGDNSRDTVQITYKENPQAFADEVEVSFGKATDFSVLANDTYPAQFDVQLVDAPARGQLTALGDGRFRYQPDIDFVGQDRLLYELCSETCACSLAEVVLEVGGDAACKVPNFITPNDDGINDTFIIPCLLDGNTYPNSKVVIFNQWGDEVFSSQVPYQNNWDGRFNGAPLPAGTYFYIIEFGNGRQEAQSGYLLIQR